MSSENLQIPGDSAGDLGDRDRDLLRRIERVAAVARKLLSGEIGTSAANRNSFGQGTMFSDHRRYAPGDDVRFVDWNAYARFDEVFLRVYEPEDSAAVSVFLDTSASMTAAGSLKFTQAARVAAAFAAIGMLVLAGARVYRVHDGTEANFTGKTSLLAMLRFIEKPPERPARKLTMKTLTFSDAVKQALARARRGPFVFITDAAPPAEVEKALRERARHPAAVLQIVDPAETDPPQRGWIRFVNPEDGKVVTCNMTERLRNRYTELVRERFLEVERAVLFTKSAFARISTKASFDAAVVGALHRGILPAARV
ncbi:MAG: DUF58 domain-containing protein [Planctomycetota bacterium]